MKQSLLSLSLVIIMSITIFSCKSELDLDKTLKFSNLSVEEQKQKLEDSGIEFIDIADGLMDTKAFTTITDFEGTTQIMYIPEMAELKSAMVKVNSSSVLKIHKQLIQREEDDMWGTFTWNSAWGEFEKTSESSGSVKEAIYIFPADEYDTGNNATFSMYYTESSVLTTNGEGTYLPKDVSVSLTVYGEVLVEGDFSCKYNDDTPSKMESSLEIEDYSWILSLVNNEKEMSEEFSIKYNNDVLMDITSKAKGNFTYDEYENSDDPTEYMDDVAVSYQVMNVSILGGIKDMNAFSENMNALDYDDSRAGFEAECEIINEYLILYAYFNDDNRKFAEVEFFVDETTEEYEDYQWNDTTWEYDIVLVEESYYETVPRLVLSDGSKVNLEDYFNNGFEELSDKLESTLEDFE